MMIHTHCTAVLLALSMLLPLAHAETSAPKPSNASPISPTAARGLSPEQISAIRKVGRNVLAAKKSGQEDGSDVAQLASLRASVEALIAADLSLESRAAISAQGQDDGENAKQGRMRADKQESARAQARALASQLRQRSELKAAQFRSSPDIQSRSAGLPIGEQRARLIERLARKLDVALADVGADRVSDLHELRQQLQPSLGRVSEASLTHGTPTLQAMPSTYVPPQKDGLRSGDAETTKK